MNTQSITSRSSKVDQSVSVQPAPIDPALLDQMPDLLGARSLRLLVERIAEAHRQIQPVIFTMGAHPIKLGLTPTLNELVRKAIVTHVATNGAAIIHDIELALFGHTSEEVIPALQAGTFGMTEETRQIAVAAINEGGTAGLGKRIGDWIAERHLPNAWRSLFAVARNHITVHVTIGADTLHLDPSLSGGQLGEASLRDFWKFHQQVWQLGKQGGVLVNWGSAVTMPEVILKSIALCRNQGVEFSGVSMFDMDMIRQYRPTTRIVDVINALGGEGHSITGHHEITLPLVAGLVLGQLGD